MTYLERLIKAHTERAVQITLSDATERIAEEMAREILKDPAFRAKMRALIDTHFSTTIRELGTARQKRKRTP